MSANNALHIAVLGGDGIGPEVMAPALEVLRKIEATSDLKFRFTDAPAGANNYLATGKSMPESTIRLCDEADAILLGACGLPSVRYPDNTEIAPQVQKTLSDLYGGLYLDPKAWSSGPPSDVYDHFTDRAVEQAKSDEAALGLGDLTGTIDTLKVASSNLEVHVLSDHANTPVAAVAKVQFVATATTKDGKHLKITRDAEYLMENVDGTWLVSGYPKSLLSVEVVTPSAGPSGATGSGASS